MSKAPSSAEVDRRFAWYGRGSTSGGLRVGSAAFASQRDECTRAVARLGDTLVCNFWDEDRGGQWEALVSEAAATAGDYDRRFTAVMVSAPSRLGRTVDEVIEREEDLRKVEVEVRYASVDQIGPDARLARRLLSAREEA